MVVTTRRRICELRLVAQAHTRDATRSKNVRVALRCLETQDQLGEIPVWKVHIADISVVLPLKNIAKLHSKTASAFATLFLQTVEFSGRQVYGDLKSASEPPVEWNVFLLVLHAP